MIGWEWRGRTLLYPDVVGNSGVPWEFLSLSLSPILLMLIWALSRTSPCPEEAAHPAGVWFASLSNTSSGALCLSRISMVAMFPWLAALWRGVAFLSSPFPGSAPAARRMFIMPRWLRTVAAWSGVTPPGAPGAVDCGLGML